jgi:hypothetical protein
MSRRGILNVVKVLNDAIKHMRKDFIPIYGDFHASTSIRDVSTGALILGFSDLLAALPPLILNDMARGVYLIGSKLAQRVRAVQIVDCTGNSTTLRLKDYISQKIEPEYKTLPWQQDVAVLLSTNEKPK